MSGKLLTDKDFMRMQRYPSPSLFAGAEFRRYRHKQTQNEFLALLSWGLGNPATNRDHAERAAPMPKRVGVRVNLAPAAEPTIKRPRVRSDGNKFLSPYLDGLWQEPKFKPI